MQVEQNIAGLPNWKEPLLIGWGMRNPWLSIDSAKAVKTAALVELEEVGHYPQENWHEKVSEALLPFLRRQTV